jgi:hypothetical protein
LKYIDTSNRTSVDVSQQKYEIPYTSKDTQDEIEPTQPSEALEIAPRNLIEMKHKEVTFESDGQ